MHTVSWEQYVRDLSTVMRALSVRDANGQELGPAGLDAWVDRTMDLARDGGCAFFAGNGASASMASHFSADLAKNVRLRSMVFTDPALITCLGNDLSYEDVFSEPLSWQMRQGDMAVLISSSGNSPNVVKAAKRARELQGIVVTLSAMNQENTLRGLGDLNIYVPAQSYSHAETSHAAILHHWIDAVQRVRSLG